MTLRASSDFADPANCFDWTVRIINNSNTEVVQFTWDPPSAKYAAGSPGTEGYTEWPADDPAAAITDVSLPAYQAQVVRFESCSSTPVPQLLFTHLEAQIVASHFGWRWLTRREGAGCGGRFDEAC